MLRFIVIGITDHPHPWFPPEVMEIICSGKVFSGGKRHHEIVAPFLPADAGIHLSIGTGTGGKD